MVSYIGPDLRVFDDATMKKNSEKVQNLLRQEEVFFSELESQLTAANAEELMDVEQN